MWKELVLYDRRSRSQKKRGRTRRKIKLEVRHKNVGATVLSMRTALLRSIGAVHKGEFCIWAQGRAGPLSESKTVRCKQTALPRFSSALRASEWVSECSRRV